MLILASKSPRRRELMRLVARDFLVVTQDADEALRPGLSPAKAVEGLALRKARAVAELYPGDTVIGADTVVELRGRLLGKPADAGEALLMLERLNGRTHRVLTGVAILAPQGRRVFSQKTAVTFWDTPREWLRAYAESGEGLDKAGAYGIQGQGSLLVREVRGDYFNVVGFPVARLARELADLCGVKPFVK